MSSTEVASPAAGPVFGLPYAPGGVAAARVAAAEPPERAHALRAVALANAGEDRDQVVREAAFVLGSPGRHDVLSFWYAAVALVHAGELDLAEEHCDRVLTARSAENRGVTRNFALAMRGRLAWLQGDPAEAAATFDRALERAAEPCLRDLLVAWSTVAHVGLGDFDTAYRRMLDRVCAASRPGNDDEVELAAALGELELAAERHEVARTAFLDCGRLLTERGVANPAVVPWRSRAALCAFASGRSRLAAVLAGRELALARRWPNARTLGVSTHAHAVVVGRGVAEAREAAEILARGPATGELLCARYDLAHFLAADQQHSQARAVLGGVRDLARKAGYAVWAARAEAACDRLARQAGDRLTAQQRTIAELARSGMTNRRIAEQQFVTVRTVEFHLSGVYRKLGVSGRRELAALPAPLP
ncbi:LuxR family transcriptional regulator [Amycolatopsis jiangsuensis]|uniref:DNA-binding CsgD family transcriptional regulator n=1 Tax=Amycolatopsis jiangsuensis TaxID=1181879 RepID=A0A840IU38_9PSEU|nr:LuxR family transcriptional regulator [Amycolatopsis jiangsuensis]MBB4684494.1 DNA-binding CsgD family transcriptional regulator [Amycolatopsis jiangsuensis]